MKDERPHVPLNLGNKRLTQQIILAVLGLGFFAACTLNLGLVENAPKPTYTRHPTLTKTLEPEFRVTEMLSPTWARITVDDLFVVEIDSEWEREYFPGGIQLTDVSEHSYLVIVLVVIPEPQDLDIVLGDFDSVDLQDLEAIQVDGYEGTLQQFVADLDDSRAYGCLVDVPLPNGDSLTLLSY